MPTDSSERAGARMRAAAFRVAADSPARLDPFAPPGPRPSVGQIKKWYQEVATLLNRLEMSGEELTLTDNGSRMEVRGLTSRAYKSHPDAKGTWSRE